MIVRRERPVDVAASRGVQAAAFPTPDGAVEPVEAGLLDELREDEAWMPDLSLVAEVDGEVVGHAVGTRGSVGADHRPAVGLGPVGVQPDHQAEGIGTVLVHALLAVAEARGESLVALLGSPGYYGRFGFVPASEHGVETPDPTWGALFQVRVLDPSAVVAGRFVYAEPFGRL